jgi:hypothetical protein
MSDTPYPITPVYKAHGRLKEAAKAIAEIAVTLRDQVVIVDCPHGITADGIAHELNRSVLSVRPRVSELPRRDEIRQTGAGDTNENGMSASVWVIEAATKKTRKIEAELGRALEALA